MEGTPQERNQIYKEQYKDLYAFLCSVKEANKLNNKLENVSAEKEMAINEGYCVESEKSSTGYELTDKGREMIWVYGSS
jgi:hypothetical protein